MIKDYFPKRDSGYFNGPFELMSYAAGAVIGAYIGWELGVSVAESCTPTGCGVIKQMDTLGTIIQNNPIMTKLGSTVCGTYIIGGLSRTAGVLTDLVMDTYKEVRDN